MLFVGFFYELIVSVKTKGWDSLEEIFFDSNLLNTPGLSKVPIYFKTSIYGGDIEDSFTKLILSGIKPNKYKEFNFKEFISEVELHLDELLRRGNLTIKLIDNKGNEHICKPFDYDSIECEPFVRTITELKYMHYKKGRKEKIIKLSPAFVDIYFKVTKNKIIDRRPCFIDHGVRVDKVSKFEEFRANQKSYISHPNLVGYINITGVVEPSITRDAFEPNDNLKPLFYTLNKLEPEIKEYIDSVLGTTNSQHTKALESKLNDALEKFLKKKNVLHIISFLKFFPGKASFLIINILRTIINNSCFSLSTNGSATSFLLVIAKVNLVTGKSPGNFKYASKFFKVRNSVSITTGLLRRS